MKVTVTLKSGEQFDYTRAELRAGNGVVQVSWDDGGHRNRKSRLWPTGDVKSVETEEE